MRVLTERIHTQDNKKYVELAGTSLEEKPVTGIITGSLFQEVDTGKWYAFDETSGEWNVAFGGD